MTFIKRKPDMSRDISPPSSKRQKLTAPTSPAQRALAPVLEPSDANSLRIFSWNINGITPFLQKSITLFFPTSESQDTIPSPSLRSFLHRHDWPSILFLQEVKIARADDKTQDAVRAAVNVRLPSESISEHKGTAYEAHFTLPDDPFNARGLGGKGKVYGVCSIFRSNLRKKYGVNVRTVDWDHEGRINVIEIIGKPAKLAIFNIYAVNGTENAYRDSTTGAVKGTRHDRKREFHGLLMQECMKLEKEGWDVLLGGDMNVAPDARDGHPKLRTFPEQHIVNRADFHAKFLEGKGTAGALQGLNGVDVWRAMHQDDRRYTYYSRGRKWGTSCDRVDYFIAGRSAWDKGMVKRSGILDSEAERGPSDHCPIWVDVKLDPLDEQEEDDKEGG